MTSVLITVSSWPPGILPSPFQPLMQILPCNKCTTDATHAWLGSHIAICAEINRELSPEAVEDLLREE